MKERGEFKVREGLGPKTELLPESFLKNLREILVNGGYELRWIKLSQPSDTQESEKPVDLGRALPIEISPIWQPDYPWRSGLLIFPDDRCLLVSKEGKVYVFDPWMDIGGGGDQVPTEYIFNYQFYRINGKVPREIRNLEADLHITYWEDNHPSLDDVEEAFLSNSPHTYTESSGAIVRVREDQEEDELFKKILTVVS